MIKELYTLKDLVANECAAVFESNNDGSAWRMYERTQTEQQLPFDDFRLINIGQIDKETGTITPCKPREITASLAMVDQIEAEEGI